MHQRINLGKKGEELVIDKLHADGFSILAQNYRIAGGEIDIIAAVKKLIIFVEVKTRTAAYFDLSSVVNTAKQKKIIKTAKEYIARHAIMGKVLRFDVALLHKNDKTITIDYIENAFNESMCPW